VRLNLELGEDGTLSGEGSETYEGFEAAQLHESLEALTPEQRQQALQSALSRYFGGAQLSKVELATEQAARARITVRYGFTSPNFARAEGNRLVLPPLTFPAYLGRRFVQLGARRTPLFIDATEQSDTQATVTVPKGFALQSGGLSVKTDSPFGKLERQEKQEGRTVKIAERFLLRMGRVPPGQYDAFAQFAGETDLLQARDLVLEKVTAPTSASR
jgi:hypothetical protein